MNLFKHLFNYGSIIFNLILCFLIIQCSPQIKLTFEKLTCEYYENPVGIENINPRFSWIVNANAKSRKQSAYQILVASSCEYLTPRKADKWNSGKVISDQSIFLNYNGSALESQKKYWWKVKVWNQNGDSSRWSEPQYFEMGLLNESDWQGAEWMSITTDNRESPFRFRDVQNSRMKEAVKRSSYPVGYFRKEFDASLPIENAQIFISSLGYYEATLNGHKISDHVLDPSPTSFDHHALYVIHDITYLVRKGKNTIGLILGNGFYGQTIGFHQQELSYGLPAVKVLLKIQYVDGSEDFITSDDLWKVSTGPIVFDNVYGGETYDARYENAGWNITGYDDTGWESSTIADPVRGELRSQLMPPVRKIKVFRPKRIFRSKNDNWIVDFGQNISGWVKISIKEKKGQIIKILYTEALTRKGDEAHPGSAGKFATGVDQIDIYICKGVKRESWEPLFTYHGFRYIEVSGLSKKPARNDLQAVLVHNDLAETGYFHCSDENFNKMIEVSKRTVVDNLHGFPEDCPHREKCGWLGDAQVTAEFCLYSYDIAGFYSKYLEDIQSQLNITKGKSSKEFFLVPPMIAPGKRGKNGSAALDWGIAEIYIPWYNYLHNGDFSMIRRHYQEMKELINYYLTFKNNNGIIENGLGDWCPPRWDRKNNPGAMECHPYISANAYFYDVLGVMKLISAKSGDTCFAEFAECERRKLKIAFSKNFLTDYRDATKWYGSQTGTIMALHFGMVPDSVIGYVLDGLKYDILEVKNGHHSTGIHGNRYIYSLLNRLGEEELSYNILTNSEFPSQAYIINCGHTTWPERQWEWNSGIEWDRSLNHPMHSGFAAYFYESVAGIKPDVEHPGYKEFTIEPAFLSDMDFVNASVKSPYGKIAVNWEKYNEEVKLQIVVPFNTQAHLKLPVSVITYADIDEKSTGKYEVKEEGEIKLDPGTYFICF